MIISKSIQGKCAWLLSIKNHIMTRMAYSAFPKGSEWRKWDLHLHTPMSGLANGFPMISDSPDWEKYLAAWNRSLTFRYG